MGLLKYCLTNINAHLSLVSKDLGSIQFIVLLLNICNILLMLTTISIFILHILICVGS